MDGLFFSSYNLLLSSSMTCALRRAAFAKAFLQFGAKPASYAMSKQPETRQYARIRRVSASRSRQNMVWRFSAKPEFLPATWVFVSTDPPWFPFRK